jgi:hypothetical protein
MGTGPAGEGQAEPELRGGDGAGLDTRVDVWDLRTATCPRVEASVGDLLILPGGRCPAAEEMSGLMLAAEADGTATFECAAAQPLTHMAGDGVSIDLVVDPRPFGLYLPETDPTMGRVELTS